jgi:hypothetical protein
MAIPLALQLLVAALPSVVKGVQGISQSSKAKKMEKGLVRPTYKTPEMINEAIAGARMRAQGTQLPGQKYTEDRLAGATAAGQRAILEAGTGSAGAINAISGLYGNQMNKELSLAEAGAQNQQRNIANLQQMLLQGAGYKDKEFQLNEYDPYKQKAATISALRGAGIQNKAGALSDLSTIGLQMMKLNAKGAFDKEKKDDVSKKALKTQLNTYTPIEQRTGGAPYNTKPKVGPLATAAPIDQSFIRGGSIDAEQYDMGELQKLFSSLSPEQQNLFLEKLNKSNK